MVCRAKNATAVDSVHHLKMLKYKGIFHVVVPAEDDLILFRSWYRLALFGLLLLPALVCQTIVPVIPMYVWEEWSEWAFAIMAGPERPGASPATQVTIIEIDRETEEKYGWPMDRRVVARGLEVLKKAGHPWLLSSLNFQETPESEDKAGANATLARAIRDYRRYIGSSLTVLRRETAEMSVDAEENVLPSSLIARGGRLPEEIPDLGLTFDEADRFLEGQRVVGMAPRYGTQSVIYCAPLYTHTTGADAVIAIPSAVAWAGALGTGRNITTSFGASWRHPRFRFPLHLAGKHCLSSPGTSTRKFFEARKIRILPFHELLTAKRLPDLRGHIALLANARMKSFLGPGAVAGKVGSGVVPEHYLNARFLDDLVSNRAIRRDALGDRTFLGSLPLVVGGALFVLSWWIPVPWLLGLTLMLFFGLLGWSYGLLVSSGQYIIPMQDFAALCLTGIGLAGFRGYLIYYGVKRGLQFRETLRQNLIGAGTLNQLTDGLAGFLKDEFRRPVFELISLNPAMHEAASSPEKVAEYLLSQGNGEAGHPGENCADETAYRQRSGGLFAVRGQVEIQTTIMGENRGLGYLKCLLRFDKWESPYMVDLMQRLRLVLGEQWERVERLNEQKIADYQTLMNNTRSRILEKFLSQSIVDKFQDGRTMEDNLNQVLNPRQTRAAVLQADIRGYSQLFGDKDPIVIVRMLQQYYGRTVDEAQKVAQVKLIGDCIFLFIEEENREGVTAVDLALHLAAILIRETEAENQRQKELGSDPVAFGIAIHFGDVIMGNLSSDNCIDYTVVGPHVNMTARMEELTKNPEVKQLLGPNGILLSMEAAEHLLRLEEVDPAGLDIAAMGLQIRSFPDIKKISYVKANAAATIIGLMSETEAEKKSA